MLVNKICGFIKICLFSLSLIIIKIDVMKKLLLLIMLIPAVSAFADTYYVSPTGKDSNPGTELLPWLTWSKAFHTARAGDIVYFRGGTYYTEVTDGRGIKYIPGDGIGENGTADNPIRYFNYPGEVPILDCAGSTATYDGVYNYGLFFIGVSYVHIKGLQIRNIKQVPSPLGEVADVCMGLYNKGSNHLKLENMDIGNVDGYAYRTINAHYAEHINCDAHDCCDYYHESVIGNWGGGFGGGNSEFSDGYTYFYGCRAWMCSDQGMCASGSQSMWIFENCWSFDNGKMVGNETGDGHGFKLGYWANPTSINPVLIMKNCISANNLGDGVTGNENNQTYAGPYHIYNNLSYNDGRHAFVLRDTKSTDINEYKRILRNNIAYQPGTSECYTPPGSQYTHSNNSWDHSVNVSNEDFVSTGLDISWLYQPRNADGSLPDVPFGKLAANSDLKDAGVDVGITYYGLYPDLGWIESGTASGDNEYPTVGIITPSNNSSYDAPASVDIEAIASDPDGTISLVEFFNNGIKVGESATDPYSINLSLPMAGSWSLTAVATDNDGAVATSSAVKISTHIRLVPDDPDDPDISEDLINIYPSPTSGEFSMDLFSSSIGDITNVSIVSMTGQTILNRLFTDELSSTVHFDITGAAPGQYILVVTSKNEIISAKQFILN